MSFQNNMTLQALIKEDNIIYNNIMNRFYQKLLEINSKTKSVCNIIIDNIKIENSRNCNLLLLNKCISNNQNSLNLLLESLIEATELLPFHIKYRLEQNLDIVLSKDVEQSDRGFMKKCNISAESVNLIKINNLYIGECFSDKPLDFLFYNTGDVNVNCGSVEILNALSKKTEQQDDEDKKVYFLHKVFGLTIEDNLFIIFLFVFIFISAMIVTFSFLYKYLIIYKYSFKNKRFF